MKAEFQKIIKLFEELEEAGETAFLTLLTRGGKSTIKLQLESSPSPPSTAQTLPPASGRRRRHRGARARARRNQRAAAHQTSQAEAATSASLDSQPSRPLRLLPSPPPESGRRRVMSCVGRLDVPTFSNMDGAPPPSPPPSLHQLDGVKPLVQTPSTPPPLSPPPLSHDPPEPESCSSPLPPPCFPDPHLFAATVLGIVHVLGVLRAGSVQRGQAVTTSVTGALVLGAGGLPSTIRIKSDRQCARTFHDICLKNP